ACADIMCNASAIRPVLNSSSTRRRFSCSDCVKGKKAAQTATENEPRISRFLAGIGGRLTRDADSCQDARADPTTTNADTPHMGREQMPRAPTQNFAATRRLSAGVRRTPPIIAITWGLGVRYTASSATASAKQRTRTSAELAV